jgi:pyruvate-ferredoxin/flavodoxin oxidoreductase
MEKPIITIDGNEAVALVAHKINEVVAIYPITPSSGMGEFADAWSAVGKTNIWGTVPLVVEMQSEGGAAGQQYSMYRHALWLHRHSLSLVITPM